MDDFRVINFLEVLVEVPANGRGGSKYGGPYFRNVVREGLLEACLHETTRQDLHKLCAV